MFDAAHVRSIFDYDPFTGLFVWKYRTDVRKEINTQYAGKIAGKSVNGYIYLMVGGKQVCAHRIAWLYVTGENPECEIDHIDGNRSNNSFLNLRLANSSQNKMNRSRPAVTKSGYRGVTFHQPTSQWRAKIQVRGKVIHIGLFSTPEEAYAHYCEAAIRHHGVFARLD